MTLLAVSTDLVMVFLSIELLSLALYVMAGFERGRLEAQEASMKYFLLGAFASAFLLYGIAFVFGGSRDDQPPADPRDRCGRGLDDFRLAGVAVALLAVGLGFKASMVPFHMWTPDAYQGAPTPVTAFMAGGDEGCGVRGVDPGARRRRCPSSAGTGSRRCRSDGPDDHLRVDRRRGADRRETDAGLFVDITRRLRRASPSWPRAGVVWPPHLCTCSSTPP